ncbi:MAG: transposase, partial [Candidatus Dadabacteria bacterium]|nr:transposase [Candidatus Dadabacteria bacterium]
MASTNRIESVWAVLKRSIVGVHHHISIKHLPRYVNEAAFRLNEGEMSKWT